MLILGIETSCDETAAAIVENGRIVRSSVVASQHDLHARYRGVVPEIASRAHLERILPVVREAVRDAAVPLEAIDGVAAGVRPGLIGSLLVGTGAAKGLAWGLGKPFLGIDHVEAHLHAGSLEQPAAAMPALGLVVSGGHTSLFEWPPHGSLRLLGRTIDDAAGEAFDKAAAMLGLGHPGGPRLERLAREGDPRAVPFPRPLLGPESLDFSFSGLKTAMRLAILADAASASADPAAVAELLPPTRRADLAAGFERAIVETLRIKLERALRRLAEEGRPARGLVAGGGVVANASLRAMLGEVAAAATIELRLPRPEHCLDNAAMIAAAASVRLAAGESDSLAIPAEPLSRHGRRGAVGA